MGGSFFKSGDPAVENHFGGDLCQRTTFQGSVHRPIQFGRRLADGWLPARRTEAAGGVPRVGLEAEAGPDLDRCRFFRSEQDNKGIKGSPPKMVPRFTNKVNRGF